MDSVALAEELAWLIKDNLSCKHFVLSAEEAFVAFLDPQETSSVGNVLTLEPMAAYHRMLLHRLADIFRLAHESIGEGEGRRLVLERCEDSCIPEVLVSDILECNEVANSCFPNAPLILKRNKDCLEAHKYTGPHSSQMSFEEREAAYLAARERIFSSDVGDSASEPQVAVPKPRSVPIVARRMIAHALGKRILAEQGFKVATKHTEHVGTSALNLTCTSLDTEQPAEPIAVEATCCTMDANSTNDLVAPSKAVEYLQVKAARRMFAQALGLGSSKSACNVSSRGVEKKVTNEGCLQNGKVQMGLSTGPVDKSRSGRASSFDCDQSGLAQLEQGRAAQRMLAQALGFRSLSIVAERSKDT
ncbi:hypothetical protein GOP47_0027004 [Adiantum capillus-veneris]|nr:hypothetical protein GOP47_0027004 [Adiantum capillus-veneris]